MHTIHIDEVYPKDEVYPFVVNFQNGYTNEKFKSESSLFYDENKSCKVVVTDVEGTLYHGEETDEALGKTLVLARNRRTGKVRLIEVGTVDLKPQIRNNLDSSIVFDNSALELGRKFGSKKNKQVLEQKEKLKQNEQAVTAQMANVSQNLTQDQLDISHNEPSASDHFYTPPINRDATSVQDVYDLNTILTPEQYDKIISEISDTDAMESLNHVIKGLARKDLSPKLKVLALFASSLYNTVFLKAHEIAKKSFVACSRSMTLNQHIIDNFFLNANGKRMRPINYKDKALIHTIIFLLLLNNFKFNIEEFSMQLKMSLKSMAVKLAMVGGYMVRSNNVSMAQLKLPLNKPPTRRMSKKF